MIKNIIRIDQQKNTTFVFFFSQKKKTVSLFYNNKKKQQQQQKKTPLQTPTKILCSCIGCNELGRVSLSELSNIVYTGQDTMLTFCEDHVLDMLYHYRRFKDLELDYGLVPFIRNPWSVFCIRANDMELHRLQSLLQDAWIMRTNFQQKLSKMNCSVGHEHWMHNIREAAGYCESRLWHPVVRRKRRRKKKHTSTQIEYWGF